MSWSSTVMSINKFQPWHYIYCIWNVLRPEMMNQHEDITWNSATHRSNKALVTPPEFHFTSWIKFLSHTKKIMVYYHTNICITTTITLHNIFDFLMYCIYCNDKFQINIGLVSIIMSLNYCTRTKIQYCIYLLHLLYFKGSKTSANLRLLIPPHYANN